VVEHLLKWMKLAVTWDAQPWTGARKIWSSLRMKQSIFAAQKGGERVMLMKVEPRALTWEYFTYCICLGFKSFVHSHLNYLVIVSPPITASASAPSATVRNFAARSNEPKADVTKVVLFDLENKIVAYSGTHTEGIRHVFSVGRHVYLVSNDGNVSLVLLLALAVVNLEKVAPFRRKANFSKARSTLQEVSVCACVRSCKDSGIG
jgi:hypothetical protein